MLWIVYLVAAALLGRAIYDLFFRTTVDEARSSSLLGLRSPLPEWVIAWPASILIGLLVQGWITYLSAYIAARNGAEPLRYGNAVAVAASALFSFIRSWQQFRVLRAERRAGLGPEAGPPRRERLHVLELSMAAAVILAAFLLMTRSLHRSADGTLVVGLSVFSDFGPHLAMIRSFSFGSNFPTQYPHFPAGDVRYHFMFQFLSGNLEYLGLPIDWAFNLPSIIALSSFSLLLYSWAVLIFGTRGVGVLAVVFFYFRSSPGWLDFIIAGDRSKSLWERIWSNGDFLGRTHHEADWGLWSQNILLNQRHLPFGLGIFLFVLILMFPNVRAAASAFAETAGNTWGRGVRKATLSAEAWLPHRFAAPVAGGLLLGLAAFWNGAAVIGALIVLASLALVSMRRIEYLLIAIFTIGLGYAQNQFFIRGGELVIKPEFTFGFLAEPRTLPGVLRYYFDLLGLLPILAVACVGFAWFARSESIVKRLPIGAFGILLAGLAPIIFATSVQLTPEVAINHKYVLIGVCILNILAAGLIWAFFKSTSRLLKGVGIVLVLVLTATGALEAIGCWNRNRDEQAIHLNLQDPLLVWAKANTKTDAIFLSDWYALHPLLLSGRKIYFGWPYFAWSAGYDTETRRKAVITIYSTADVEQLVNLVQASGVNYILISDDNRTSNQYKLNEPLLRSVFPVVFEYRDMVVLQVPSS